MGGVDLHDNAVQNYRINRIRSKKWYWSLFITCIDSCVVNTWNLHCFIRRFAKEKPVSQKDFRVEITEALLFTFTYHQDSVPKGFGRKFSYVKST